MKLIFETENWIIPDPLRSHIEQSIADLESSGVPDSAAALIEIYVSGDHLYNVTVTISWGSFKLSANSSHHNPYLAVTTAFTQVKCRAKSIIETPA